MLWSPKSKNQILRLTRASSNICQRLQHQKIKCRCYQTLKLSSRFIQSLANLYKCLNTRKNKLKNKFPFKRLQQVSDLIRHLPASQLATNRTKDCRAFCVCLKSKLLRRVKVLMKLSPSHAKMTNHRWRKSRTSPKNQVRKNRKEKRIPWSSNFYQIISTKNSSLNLPKGLLSLIPGNRLLKSSVTMRTKFRLTQLANPTKMCLEFT